MLSREDWTNSGTTVSTHWSQRYFEDTDYWSAKRSFWPISKAEEGKGKGKVRFSIFTIPAVAVDFVDYDFWDVEFA